MQDVRGKLNSFLKDNNFIEYQDIENEIFSNLEEILAIHRNFLMSLAKRQEENYFITKIGDLLVEFSLKLDPYIIYSSSVHSGIRAVEIRRRSNLGFLNLLCQIEQMENMKKLSFQNFILLPTTRLAKYPLLISACIKRTKQLSERSSLEEAHRNVKNILDSVNIETGKASNKQVIEDYKKKLYFENPSLEKKVLSLLTEPNLSLVRNGKLLKKSTVDATEYSIALFSNFLILAKVRETAGKEEFYVKRNVMQFEFIVVFDSGKIDALSLSAASLNNTNIIRICRSDSVISKTSTYPFTIYDLKSGYIITLIASTFSERKQWIDLIEYYSSLAYSRGVLFKLGLHSELFLTQSIRCYYLYDDLLLIGTENALYYRKFTENESAECKPKLLVKIGPIKQIMVCSKNQLLFLRLEKSLVAYSLVSLMNGTSVKRREISKKITFFALGEINERSLLVVCKSRQLGSTLKIYEIMSEKSSLSSRIMALMKTDVVNLYRKIFIGSEVTSVIFISSKLIICCPKGFELADLDSLYTQDLLDPADESLIALGKRYSLNARNLFKLEENCFFLCFSSRLYNNC